MTTIRLGVGDDAVEVEDGASVPLRMGGERATLHLIGGDVVVRWGAPALFARVYPETGTLYGGWSASIDLAALRLERAPKPKAMGAWTSQPVYENISGCWLHIGDPAVYEPLGLERRYWTHRPGNTPEKQAAFDAAMDNFIDAIGPGTAYGGSPLYKALYSAAAPLGYGGKHG